MASLPSTVAELSGRVSALAERLEDIARAERSAHDRQLRALHAIASDEPLARERLHRLRSGDGYQAAFTESDPLVSVIIPTHTTYPLLAERSIPSVLAQTHRNLEIVVVGDAAPEEARAVVEGFGDPRIRFDNLAYAGPYPEDPRERWLASGTAAYNRAARLARGAWLAPLNDDDAFRPEHIELLLGTARRDRAELAYGRVEVHRPDGSSVQVGVGFPPSLGDFALQGAIYHAGIAAIFEQEFADAVFELPNDWGLCLRMLRAGVRMTAVDAVVADGYPSALWLGREGASSP